MKNLAAILTLFDPSLFYTFDQPKKLLIINIKSKEL